MQAHGVVLEGCSGPPLGGWLKGLGVLRLAGTQLDPAVRGWWTAGGLAVTCELAELATFLLDRYQPSPVVAPWNAGSGVWAQGRQQAVLAPIEQSTTPRLAAYRAAITEARQIAAEAVRRGWATPQRPDAAHKQELVGLCRARLPDGTVAWLDACACLVDPGMGSWVPEFRPLPLAGTGGNFGRLELGRVFAGHVATVLGVDGTASRERSLLWLGHALTGTQVEPVLRGSPLPWFPGGYGDNDGLLPDLVNPWDVVLAVEGAIAMAPAMEHAQHGCSPWMPKVRPGEQFSAEEVQGEVWAPLWEVPLSAGEALQLCSGAVAAPEGTPTQRYVLATRHGQMPIAVPAGRAAHGRPEWLGR